MHVQLECASDASCTTTGSAPTLTSFATLVAHLIVFREGLFNKQGSSVTGIEDTSAPH